MRGEEQGEWKCVYTGGLQTISVCECKSHSFNSVLDVSQRYVAPVVQLQSLVNSSDAVSQEFWWEAIQI